jgi:hypothetical protein
VNITNSAARAPARAAQRPAFCMGVAFIMAIIMGYTDTLLSIIAITMPEKYEENR